VEMQNVAQPFYKDRSVYYASFPIVEQGKRGDWDYKLQAVYTVGILNFVLRDEGYSDDDYCHNVMLTDIEDNHVFFDKLRFIYLEMPKFKKTEDELVTMFDKWMFVLKNLPRLFERPAALQERVFKKLFEQAEIARFTKEQRISYEYDVMTYRDLKNSFDLAVAQGEAKEQVKIAKNLKAMGMSNDQIAQATGLTEKQISEL